MEFDVSPPEFEETYRRYEFAPLVAFALIVANWVKPRSVESPEKHETAGAVSSTIEPRLSH